MATTETRKSKCNSLALHQLLIGIKVSRQKVFKGYHVLIKEGPLDHI